MKDRISKLFPAFLESLLNSYSQIFFSHHRFFAVILIVVSFLDLHAGISGLLAVLTANTAAYLIGFSRHNIRSGYYGFNALLVGLGLGIYYQTGLVFLVLLLFVSLLTMLVTVSLEGVIGKYGLPYLSVPFLLVIWLVVLAARDFTSLEISERGIYTYNELFGLGGFPLVGVYKWLIALKIPAFFEIYFRSLGAIFFQYHIIAGVLLAIGLLMYSRIAFLASFIGFSAAYFFYYFVGASISSLSYSYIGFNFVLTAIAIGGYFVIPSWQSFLWVLLLTPLQTFIVNATAVVLEPIQLSVFALPFNVVVLLFIYTMKFRERFVTHPQMVMVQHNSPEENLYSHLNYQNRFVPAVAVHLALPFWGKWKVTQAHEGAITHQGDWKHAWDFEVFSDDNQPFKGQGLVPEDYYCYNKPILAAADGWVEEILDGVDDNEIGKVNLEQNWGNTIILRHAEGLYSKTCHLKKYTFRIQKGDFVKKGDVLASCGNSGRSPQPHVHFQLQATPYIGSPTLDYPLAYFLKQEHWGLSLQSFAHPLTGDIVVNAEISEVLEAAFRFVPGQKLSFNVSGTGKNQASQQVHWEVEVDALNNTCLHCETTNDRAYFSREGMVHYFTHYKGSRHSFLYYFYLVAYKVVLGYFNDLRVEDRFPLSVMHKPAWKFLQDFVAPFYRFVKAEYRLDYVRIKDDFTAAEVELHARFRVKIGRRVLREVEASILLKNKRIEKIEIREDLQTITAVWSSI